MRFSLPAAPWGQEGLLLAASKAHVRVVARKPLQHLLAAEEADQHIRDDSQPGLVVAEKKK
jgi:hypothetical protein